MAGLKVSKTTTVKLDVDNAGSLDDVLKKIALAAGVDKTKIHEARLHFEGAQPRKPQSGVLTLSVATVETVTLESVKADLDADKLVNFFDIVP